MSNLAGVLQGLGRGAESAALARKLEQMDPNPAFRSFNLGMKAMQQGNYASARDLFAKEVDRAPYYHEFHFWLALAYVGLGETENARSELKLALEYSTTRKEHELYAAKLDRIRSSHLQ
jgi:tetratricopeptide (TPR) repeat protein